MAGIYIHIPFCRKACHYCDFHFSTNLSMLDKMVEAICIELRDRKNTIARPIKTIYFGGGTPSLLPKKELQNIIKTVFQHYEVDEKAEITLEANPEDLTLTNCKTFHHLGINRLSVGVQTFDAQKLQWMNRNHDVGDVYAGFQNARDAGFSNISLDFMYALNHTHETVDDLQKAISIDPEHISLYGLTIEPRTVFGKWKQTGKIQEIPEEKAASQYLGAIGLLAENGFEQYEVSNFSKAGYRSRHNGAYWAGVPYLGVGPGAHSFQQYQRRANVRNNKKYIDGVSSQSRYFDEEALAREEQVNELVLTQLRTIEGIDLRKLETEFGIDLIQAHGAEISSLKDRALIKVQNGHLSLTPEGFLVADEIAMRFFSD